MEWYWSTNVYGPSIAHRMRFTRTFPVVERKSLESLLGPCNRSESSIHGALTIVTLTEILLQSAALAVTRPGSWD